MDLPDFITDFPITLANWHSASSNGVPVTTLRNRTLYEHDYIDSGGSGIYVHRPDSSTFKAYQLKCDSMGASPYYPKCFALPLATSSKRRLDRVPDEFQLDRNHCNSLFYNDGLECFFSADPITNRLHLYRLERNEESPSLTKLEMVSSTSSICELSKKDGPICEISCFDSKSNETFFIRQSKRINLLKLKEQDDQLILSPQEFIIKSEDKRKSRLINEFDQFTEFWKISRSHFLKHNLAIGQYGEDNCVTLSDYNMETKQFIWICSSSKTDFKRSLSWQSPVNLFWTRDHPKLLAYCELNQFALLDTRSNKTILSIMDRKRSEFARDWEKFRDCCQLSISDTQFLLTLDHKVILVDRRYPQKNLLTWNHMLPTNNNNLPRFLSSTTINNSKQSIITLANNNQSCLMTINPFELTNIIQPKSLHLPLQLSTPTDFWHYSPNVVDDLCNQLEKYTLTGLIVIPTENGYSIIQSTTGDNIYVQDFYPASTIEPEYRISWNRSCINENLTIPDEINSLLESAFSNLSFDNETESSDDSNWELTQDEPLIVPTESIKPKFLIPLPGSTSDTNESQLSSDDESEQLPELIEKLIEKRVNLLTDDIGSIDENQLTIKLLSKWRDGMDNNQ